MKPDAKSLAISSPMSLRFSSLKRCKRYLTGLEPGLIFKACSVTSLRILGMSEGFHAKMSRLAQRKSTSVPSYLGERAVPMRTVLSMKLSASTRTSLTFSAGSKDLAARFASGAPSALSFSMAVSSSKARVPKASSQLSTSHS